jgi:diaminopimelate decarboxylase
VDTIAKRIAKWADLLAEPEVELVVEPGRVNLPDGWHVGEVLVAKAQPTDNFGLLLQTVQRRVFYQDGASGKWRESVKG